jgi:2,5-dioxopentanoate dehydrogenase
MNTNNTDIQDISRRAWQGYLVNKNQSLLKREEMLKNIASEIEAIGEELIKTAMEESNLPEARIVGERGRTMNQLLSFAAACKRGDWMELSIDTADATRTPPKPDLRSMMIPTGPVLVFGASNFPLAFSTAGGDTASALAAGCSVVVKAHPGHIKTSRMVAKAISIALEKSNLSQDIFIHVEDNASNELATALIKDKNIKSIAFTGSPYVGKAIWKMANERSEPIPVFAEMSSINPIFILEEKMKAEHASLATTLVGSINMGAGQFCTNPGLIVVQKGAETTLLLDQMKQEFSNVKPSKMLNQGIADNYRKTKTNTLTQPNITLLAQTSFTAEQDEVIPTIATVDASDFITNESLLSEVFGAFSLVVQCETIKEMEAVANFIDGQLTSTFMATTKDLENNMPLVDLVKEKCGRLIINNVPTGVEVNNSMQHGGPWPSTTDSRFTSVGTGAIKRFIRPMSFQNYPPTLLPEALQNENPLALLRKVNNVLTADSIK